MSDSFFRGAGLIITDKPENNDSNKVIIVTQYADSLSELVFELGKKYADHIDHLNKYEFYPALGNAANEYLSKGNNKMELYKAVRKAAESFWR